MSEQVQTVKPMVRMAKIRGEMMVQYDEKGKEIASQFFPFDERSELYDATGAVIPQPEEVEEEEIMTWGEVFSV